MSLKNLSAKIKIPKIFKDKLKNKRINQIYKRFEKSLNTNENFGVAVSGGPDSLALTAFAKAYSYGKDVKISFVLVNHNIRPNSSKEAYQVKVLLKKHNIKLNVLNNNLKIENNIQSQARNIRYSILSSFCVKKNIKTILTGHNLDDQVA